MKVCPIHKNRQLYDNGFCSDCGKTVTGDKQN